MAESIFVKRPMLTAATPPTSGSSYRVHLTSSTRPMPSQRSMTPFLSFILELPKAPGQLQLTSVQSRSAELQWLDDDVDPLLEYCVQLTRPNTGWTYNHTIEAGRNIITLPNLHPSTTYHVQVNAVNSAGVGPPSALVEFQTHEEGSF